MKTQTPERNRFEELYQVSLDYQKADGYWVCSHKEDVLVSVEHGMTEKDNHAAAEAIAKTRYPRCRINGATYC
jgi:hypothetical protein